MREGRKKYGLVAQLGERTVRIREVRGFDPLQVHQNKKAPDRVLFCFGLSPGDRTGAVVNDVPGARQSRDPASAAAEVDPLQVHQFGKFGNRLPFFLVVRRSLKDMESLCLSIIENKLLSW